ncbi:hypothetical protein [Pontibacter mucosus]|nr:hypothetical protein [Pontibacter mucosus]
MKRNLLSFMLLVLVAAFFASCQKTYCPAYASHRDAPIHKPTFLKDQGRR